MFILSLFKRLHSLINIGPVKALEILFTCSVLTILQMLSVSSRQTSRSLYLRESWETLGAHSFYFDFGSFRTKRTWQLNVEKATPKHVSQHSAACTTMKGNIQLSFIRVPFHSSVNHWLNVKYNRFYSVCLEYSYPNMHSSLTETELLEHLTVFLLPASSRAKITRLIISEVWQDKS